jgi:hypothetical protein
MTKTQDPFIIPMCSEHPQNRPRQLTNLGNENTEYSKNLGWTDVSSGVWRKVDENVVHVHIPINIMSGTHSPTTWDCMSLETGSATSVYLVDYTNKTMQIIELKGYPIWHGPRGKLFKYLVYEGLDYAGSSYNRSWNIVSYAKFENKGYFMSSQDACNYAINLLAIDKAKIDMEILKVQLQLI